MDDLLAAGTSLCRQGHFDRAIEMLKAEIRRTPERLELHQRLVSTMVAWARNQGLTGPVIGPGLKATYSQPRQVET
jgi:hypothetical protein